MIDLSRIGNYRENNRIEAKKALGGLPHSIWETYSAFANTLGGLILLGVEEYRDRTLHPIDLPDPERLVREFWALVNDPAKASINILTAGDVTVEDAEGKHIVVIRVPRADRVCKPVYLNGDPTDAYRRDGEGDYRCTAEDLQAMARDAEQRTQDMRVMEDADLQLLCGETLRGYRARMHTVRPGHAWEALSDADFLEAVGAAAKGRDSTAHPTAAGLLMFGRASDILRAFPRYTLHFRTGSGARGRIDSSSGDWSGNVFDFFFRVSERLRRSLRFSAASPEYRALRGVLVNCLVHADYCGRGGISVVRTKESVRLSNPGTFRIDPEAARAGGRSDPRNGAMLGMFRLIDEGERTGSGIPDLFRVWRARGWADPVITQSVRPDRTALVLPLLANCAVPRPTRLKADPARQREDVILFLTDAALADSAAVARRLGTGLPRARAVLNGLIAEGIVVAEGGGNRRKYKLKR